MKWRLLVLLVVFTDFLFAQQISLESQGQYTIKQWTTENGLAQNSVRDLVKGSDQIVWIATFGGLVQFDGTNFTQFDIGNTPNLGSNRIIDLYLDSKECLWLAHEDLGLTQYYDGQFRLFGKDTEFEKIHYDQVLEDSSGNFWFATNKGLMKLINHSIVRYGEPKLPGVINTLAAIADNQMVLSSGVPGFSAEKKVTVFDGEQIAHEVTIDNDIYWRLQHNNHDSFWILLADRIISTEGKEPYHQDTLLLPKEIHKPRAILTHQNKMWVGTESGLFCLTVKDHQITSYRKILEDVVVNDLVPNDDQSIWVGSEGSGLFLISKKEITIWDIDDNTLERIGPVCTDGKGGVWMSSLCDYLIHYDGNEFDRVFMPPECIQGLHYNALTGQVLANTANTILQINSARIDTLVTLPRRKYTHRITTLFVDRDGYLWTGATSGEIKQYVEDEVKSYQTLPDNHIQIITQLESGAIWVGANAGITIVDQNSQQTLTKADGLVSGAIRSIHEDSEGIVWAGSYGGGLSRIEGGSITTINAEVGLSENVVSRIYEDEHERIWMLGNLGIFMTTRQMLNDYADGKISKVSCIELNASDGMREGNGAGGVVKSKDGLTWWATIDGVASLNVGAFEVDSSDVPINIQSIKSNNTDIPIAENKVTLDVWQRDFEITYTGVFYQNPDRINYKHQLEGYDKHWMLDGNRRTITYTNLPPGKYTLKIQASNAHNVWSRKVKEIDLVIKPKWWQLRGVQMTSVAILILLVAYLFKLRTAQLLKRKKMLEQQVRIRTKQLEIKNGELQLGHDQLEQTIDELKQTQDQLLQSEKMASLGVLAAGVAHEINNPLNYIRGGIYSVFTILGEKYDELDQEIINFKDTIDEGINRTTQIVQSLNQFSRNGDSMDEICHINDIIDSCLVMLNSELKGRVEVTKNFQKNLAPINGNVSNLLQVFINLLANASQAIQGCGEIIIMSKGENEAISITISDNGVGIPEDELLKVMDPFFTTKPPGKGTGLGLAITYEIIQNHKGHISVESEVGIGTTFVVTFPIEEEL